MGDLRTSDGSWKKMVIAKSNNAWISTIKSESIGSNETATMNTNNLAIGQTEYAFKNIKREKDADNDESSSQDMIESETMMVDMDPLLIPCRAERSRSSGPKSETPEERASRLAKMSAYAARRLANESPEQRAMRLKRMSEYAAKRLSQETREQRARRLSRMSAYAAKRLASETPEQRHARLTRMSAYAARRQAMKKGGDTIPGNSYNPTNFQYDSTHEQKES